MNILIFNDQAAIPFLGGIERVSDIMANELPSHGYNIFILAIIAPNKNLHYTHASNTYYLPNPKQIDSNENLAYVINLIRSLQINVLLNQRGVNLPMFSLCLKVKKKTSIRLISQLHHSPDISQISLNSFLYFSPLQSEKSIAKRFSQFKHILFLPYHKFRAHLRDQKIYTNVAKNSDAIILLSDKFIPLFYRHSKVQARIVIIPNPLSYDTTDQIDYTNNKKKIVLYVGRLSLRDKRPDWLLQVWKEIEVDYPEWKLIFIGDGEYKADLEEYSARNNLQNVHFLGALNPAPFYQESTILCLTSISEGFGLVLTEAAQFGNLLMAFACTPAMSDMISEGVNGFLVSPYSIQEYSTKLRRLMDIYGSNQHKYMMEQSQKMTYKYKKEIIINQWAKLFQSL